LELNMKRLIFVYGTLKRGFGNNTLLARAKLLAPATTVQKFKMYSYGGFPAVFESNEDCTAHVAGEIYEVSDENTMANLDGLEGHPDWYRRTPVVVEDDDGNYCEAEMYVAQPGRHHRLDGLTPLQPKEGSQFIDWQRGM
jgi:gamma-glutamylaminecyclotransferase